jgi:hypothetical protein
MNAEPGTQFSHDELAELMLVKSGSQKYYNQMQKAIANLTEFGVRLSNVKGHGYKVLTPDEWLDEAKAKAKKGGKSIYEAQNIINNAPLLQMSEDVRMECLKMHDAILKHKFMLTGGVVSIVDNNPKKQIQTREGNQL